MSEYNPSDLTSTLVYIKNRFGTEVFSKRGRVPALVSDLAPSLKNDRVMLERMSRLGILGEFVSISKADDSTRKRLISKTMTLLTHSEYIRPAIAATYLSVLVDVFEWNIKVEIPKESSVEKMKFDSARYLRESMDREYLLAKKAMNEERFDEARLLLSKCYGAGNILAGVNLGEIYYSGYGCEKDYKKAVQLFVDGMSQGNPLGAEWLATAYKWGRSVPKDKNKAMEIYESCCDALLDMCACGCADAQYVYGFDMLYGNFTSVNYEQAFHWLTRAMESGHKIAGVNVARMYLNGWGCEQNVEQAIDLLRGYSNASIKGANFELGKIYYYGTYTEKDYIKALHYFRNAAKMGHASAQDYVGDIYYFGDGVEIDYAEARKWYELSGKQGNKLASQSLGFIYYYGEGVAKDGDKAFKYFKDAADSGVARAQYMLHHFYFFDDKFKDYELGKAYLQKSAEQGDVLAQKLLAKCYIGSFGLAEDDEQFVYWIKRAADQDDAEAQRILGEAYIMLENAEVLPESYAEAIKWLDRAATQGDIRSLIHLAKIYSAGEGIEKDLSRTTDYLQQAEHVLADADSHGQYLTIEHKELADLYYKLYSDKANRQIAFDHYCKALSAGDRSVTYDVGWMYFVNGYKSNFLNMSDVELLNTIEEEEDTSQSSSLAYLLGQIYYNGYKVIESKSEAEKWYLKAKEKGSLSACCRLAFYYINELRLFNKGFAILDEAHKRGSVEGTRLLGLCYKNGIGVKKSRSKAKVLLKEAAQNGDKDAAEELKKFLF